MPQNPNRRRTARISKRSQRLSSNNHLSFEKLEDRKLLASVTFDAGLVTVRGDNTADVISLTSSADRQSFTVDVNDDPSLSQTFDYSEVTGVTVFALGGNDRINNTLFRDTTIYGQNGNDVIYGGFRNDRLFGGSGIDTIVGRTGDDYISGGDDNDRLYGSNGNDTLYGGNGNDTIYGQNGNDFVNGQAGNDSIHGGNGDDSLYGAAGNDTINGNAGLDRINGGNGNDYLNGGTDRDIISGSNGDDVLLGEAGNDYLAGNDGNDRIYGQEGADTLLGQAGDDLLDAGFDQNVDRLTGGSGLDEFVVLGNIGSGSVDVVNDRAGFETYNGYRGPLTALVEVDGDTLNIRGMESRDVIYFYAVSGQSQFRVTANGEDMGTYSNSAISEVVVNGNGGNDHIDNNNRSIVAMRVDGGAGNDTIRGGRSNDILSGGSGADAIDGRDGDDEVNGGNDNDRLYGYRGNDTINGDAGNDLIYGHDGDDEINGGAGDDLIFGQDDDDTINGEAGNDRLYGQDGDDILKGALGNDRIWGGDDNDTIEGNWGHDELRGESGDDTIRGGDGDDYLHGGAHNDTLFGDAGVDELWGGGHDDILSGGTDDEIDILWGNGGTDEFFAVRDDNVRDRHSSEASTDPVLRSAEIVGATALIELNSTEGDDFLSDLPADAARETSGGLEIVTAGARKLVFSRTSQGSLEQLINVPSGYSTSEIEAAITTANSFDGDPTIATLQGDISYSVVPVEAFDGELDTGGVEFADVIVAAGSGAAVAVGGVTETGVDSGVVSRSITQFSSSSLDISSAATVVSNIAGIVLSRASDPLVAGVTQTVLGQFQSPVTGIVAQQFVSTAFQLGTYALLTPGAENAVAKNGAIAQVTVAKPNPTIGQFPKLKIKEPGEIWFRNQIVLTPKLLSYRTEDGKGLGDFVVVRNKKAVVIELKRPVGGKAVQVATFKAGSAQISKIEYPNAVKKTAATSVTGALEVTLPLNPTAADYQIILNEIKRLTP